jgi:Rap1a immunity proteins
MRFLILWAVGALATLSGHSSARADNYTVHVLYQACTSPRESQMFARCFGYIEGVADSMIGENFCIADGIMNFPAIIQVFVNWASAHPEKWDEAQIAGVMDALGST